MPQPVRLICLILFVNSTAFSWERTSDDQTPKFITNSNAPQIDNGACFSADGKTVLFSRGTRQHSKRILFTVPASGGEARRLNDEPLPVSARRASWSKDNYIAFTGGTRNRKQQLWLIASDGSDARQIQASGLSDRVFYPSWHSDGQRLVVLDGGKRILQEVDLRKKTAVPLTKKAEVLVGMPSVSPDGKTVAFAGQKNTGRKYDQTKNSIWLLSDNDLRPLEARPMQGRTPAWSPDGSRIAFESNRGSPNSRQYAIFVIDRNGENLRQLTPFAWNAKHPAWSPDGRRIVFSARNPLQPRRNGGIAIIEVER